MANDLRKAWGIGNASAADAAEAKRRADEKAERLLRGKSDRAWFCEYYFPHYFSSGLADWQYQVFEEYEASLLPQTFIVPRGHGKTVTAQFALIVCDVLTGRHRFAVYMGATSDIALERREDILSDLENNERLLDDYGVQRGSGRAICWKTGSSGLRFGNRAKIEFKGAGQALRGMRDGTGRPDLCVCDDLDDDKQEFSETRYDKLIRWMKKSVVPLAGAKGMKLLIIGNLIGLRTLLQWCLDNPKFLKRLYKAIIDEEKGILLMPNLWTIEAFQEIIDTIGRDAFNCEYQNEPADMGAKVFQEAWFAKGWTDDMLATADDPAIYVAVDPSKGKKKTSDYTAIVGVRRNWRNGHIYIVKADVARRPLLDLLNRMVTVCDALGVSRIAAIGFECVQFQEYVANDFDKACATAGITLRVVKIEQHLSKDQRIQRMVGPAEGGRLWFPPRESRDEGMKLLFDQLTGYPHRKYDDGPDALEMVIDMSNMLHRGSGAAVAEASPWDRVYGTG